MASSLMAQQPEAAAAKSAPDYRIAAGDLLDIITWKEPDFSKEVIVRLDGKITFPLLDDIQAEGRTPVDIKNEIASRLKQYVSDPLVTVMIKAPQGHKFYVLGEVARPGEYQLIKELTVLQAFALAGGFTQWAAKDEIILLRRESGGQTMIKVNVKDIQKGKNLDQDIAVRINDTIVVP
jgi:polysaccharide export outer membrane protein